MGRPEKASRFAILGAAFRKSLAQPLLVTLITWFGGPTLVAAQNTGNSPPSPPTMYLTSVGSAVTEVNASISVVSGFLRIRGDGEGHRFLATSSTNQVENSQLTIVPRLRGSSS